MVRGYWEPLIHHEIDDLYYRIISCTRGNERLKEYVDEFIMCEDIIRKLNPLDSSRVLANKGMYDTYFSGVERPKEIVRKINDTLFDSKGGIMTESEAVKSIVSNAAPVVLKDISGSFGGKNISFADNVSEEEITGLLRKRKNNYVVQEIVSQSCLTKQLNPTSLNTFRIVTLLLNGRLSVLAAALKYGGPGSRLDNATQGGGYTGITPEGRLTWATSTTYLRQDYSPSGIYLPNVLIPCFGKVLSFAKDLHKRIPLYAFAAWDIALDSDDSPVLIEVNLHDPDVWLIQILNGPVFADRHEEVIDYVFNRNVTLYV